MSMSAIAEENDNLENIIVTGSYSAVEQAQITSSAIVVERDALLALSPHSLVDALRQVPSLMSSCLPMLTVLVSISVV